MKPIRAYMTLTAIFVTGFVAFGWSWHGAKHARYVPLELPWVLSGGLAGLALVGLSIVSWHIYLGRRDDQAHRADWNTFTEDLADVLNFAARSGTEQRSAPAARAKVSPPAQPSRSV